MSTRIVYGRCDDDPMNFTTLCFVFESLLLLFCYRASQGNMHRVSSQGETSLQLRLRRATCEVRLSVNQCALDQNRSERYGYFDSEHRRGLDESERFDLGLIGQR